jgi:ATP-dependent exoDNAse (exonuclease V) alpha subunit
VLADGTGTTHEHRRRERTTVAIAERLAGQTVPPIPATLIAREAQRLDRELARAGGTLSSEQHRAIEIGCGARQLVVLEGQAGTGKSTTLTGITRAHQAAGQEIVVTSTAALAAERLASELARAGVEAPSYSTNGLRVAIDGGRVELGPGTTVIHDEAALASTTEQGHLFDVVQASGARLIEVGDPAQSQPVGAGGLWPHLERAARQADAHVELTRNQRARDPDDRRDQAMFRAGEHEQAIRGYADRERVQLTGDATRAEDLALDAAQADRDAGKTTIVLAQTSNEHLDELNARAQAIRDQNEQLGRDSIAVPGRPYQLHTDDQVQIRRTTNHPDHGQLRNGTTARIVDVDPTVRRLVLDVGDGELIALEESQVARADLRLAYVQHPFPAQGQTTDTAHLIVSDNATAEGSYVAITRARDRTDLYSAIDTGDRPVDSDPLQSLAERVSRTEPELPSIRVPLKHESSITIQPDQRDSQIDQATTPDLARPTIAESAERTPTHLMLDADRMLDADISIHRALPGDVPGHRDAADARGGHRRWPQNREPDGMERDAIGSEPGAEPTHRTRGWGWEP